MTNQHLVWERTNADFLLCKEEKMSKGYTYTLKIDAEIQGLTAKVDQAKKSMQALIDSGKAPGAERMFANIT
jgi:hypothetical protein